MNGSKLTSVTIDGVTKSIEGNIYNFNDVNKMSVVTFNFTSISPVKPMNIRVTGMLKVKQYQYIRLYSQTLVSHNY